jgi:hypothetical protein
VAAWARGHDTSLANTAGIVDYRRLWTVLLVGAAMAAQILIAAGLALRQGQPLRWPERDQEAAERTSSAPRSASGRASFAADRLIMIAGWVLLLASVVLIILSPEARKRFLTYLPIALGIILILGRAFTPNPPQSVPTASPPGLLSRQLGGTPQAPSPAAGLPGPAPQWSIVLVSVGLSLVLAAITGGAIFLAWRRYRRPASSVLELAEEARDALHALQTGADLKDSVMRCYARMLQVASLERGVRREQHVTPREFGLDLAKLGLPTEPINQLTRLFEDVRYGSGVSDEETSSQAVAALRAVLDACESGS